MKFNRNNTALHFLDNPAKMEFNLPEDYHGMTEYERLSFGHSFRESFGNAAEVFRKRIQFVSNPFLDAYHKAKHKLVDVLFNSEIEQAGTLILKGENSQFTQTWFYMVNAGMQDGIWKYNIMLALFTKHNKNDHISLDAYLLEVGDSSRVFLWKEWGQQEGFRERLVSDVLGIITFLKHCELETKVVKAGRKSNHVGQKYVNESKNDIEILDSTWFTTIIRSEGFGVGGHFRMQPYGPCNSMRKLIWIEPFEKSGYTRTAKVLNT